VELLATLALAGIVLPVAVHGIVLCLAAGQHAREQAEAAALARSKMDELVVTGDLVESEMSGDFGDQWPAYEWLALVREWEDAKMSELDVYVTWTRRGREYYVLLSTLVYTGTASGTGATTETTGTAF
jgi:hypothetical protein